MTKSVKKDNRVIIITNSNFLRYKFSNSIYMSWIFLLLVMFLNINFSLAQNNNVQNQDVLSIDNIIKAYYDVVSGAKGESVDIERDLNLHHPNAWVAISYINKERKPNVRVMTLKEFHGDNKPRKEGFYEREIKREVKRYGNMAHVWSYKAISKTPNGEPIKEGVNTITLFHDGKRWWIMSWMIDNSVEASND